MLRLLIKDITVEKPQPKQLLVHIRWQGGACTHHSVRFRPASPIACGILHRWSTECAI
jgi:hypothetical protein